MGQRFFSSIFNEEIKVLRAKFGPQFRDYAEILADSSYVFTNSNPYLDYPRPMLHKTVPLGGITVHTDPRKNVLTKEWDRILSERNTTVLVSFGTVAKSIYMPDEYKRTLLEVFESLPETTFIFKYEDESSQMAAHLKNVHLSSWVPQNALLADPRLTAFITHGGLGSVIELAYLGKPAIFIPIFADQTRNAHMLSKHGGGIVLNKVALEHPQLLRESLRRIFNDASFSRNAKRLSQMLINQPISAKELLIRHSEFAAKFGRLPNLDPYGRQLSIFHDAYKFLVYSPLFGYSHTNFMGAIADILTEAGHDVRAKTGVKLTKKIIKTPIDPRVEEMMRYKSIMLSHMWTVQPSIYGLIQSAKNMTASFTYLCEHLISDDALIRRLADEKFDVGIAEAFSICGLGIFEVLKIPSSISTFSGVHLDIISNSIGEPITPSYVPGAMSTKGDRMNFIDRLKNLVDTVMGQRFFSGTFVEEIKAFRSKFGPQFKGYEEILADASYVFTNSNPYLDYPRPMLHKTVPLGGVAVHIDPKKNVLNGIAYLSERNTTVLVSFGSVAKSIYMPDEYRKTLLEVFESMPDTTFIWKYEAEGSQIAAHLENVHLSTWVPQNALLAFPTMLSGFLRCSMNQPISARQLLIRHSEFAAKFGRLPNLDPYGRHLSMIEYFLIDIFLVAASTILVIGFVVVRIVRRCFAGKTKSKKE
ncbi:glycosyltransferase family 28 protein [Ostertagia ostertagi]